MGNRYGALAFTERVKALQEASGSRRAYAKREGGPESNDRLGRDEADFIAARDSFYLASISETGWPYLQHRGGPAGFVRVVDERTLVFGDVRGNKQFISVGNVQGNDRVSLLFMDYPNQTRLKLLGHAELISLADLPAEQRPLVNDQRALERYFRVRVEAFDWNCPQGITPRFTVSEIELLMG
jgi:predicted pyridoxine 5'-phosphate oxidase superfamily flavin-nucleotide-binding protein